MFNDLGFGTVSVVSKQPFWVVWRSLFTINFIGGEQNFKRGMPKREDRDWTTLPTWMVFDITNLQIFFFYIRPWNEFYGQVIYKSFILTFLPKKYSFRVHSLHRISSVIWTGIAAYRTLCTSQVIYKQNTTSKFFRWTSSSV